MGGLVYIEYIFQSFVGRVTWNKMNEPKISNPVAFHTVLVTIRTLLIQKLITGTVPKTPKCIFSFWLCSLKMVLAKTNKIGWEMSMPTIEASIYSYFSRIDFNFKTKHLALDISLCYTTVGYKSRWSVPRKLPIIDDLLYVIVQF